MKTNEFVQYDKERLKEISIKSVADHFGPIKRSGSTYKTLCPWHDDHDPSLGLVEGSGKNYCHCFSCGKGGDVIEYVKKALNVNYLQACEWLSREYGIPASGNQTHFPRTIYRPVKKEILEIPSDHIPMEMLDELVSIENSLCQCLMQWYHPEAVERVVDEYRIGRYTMNNRDDITVFPNIDMYGRLCNLKVQCYETDKESPKFSHSIKGRSYMLATIWQSEGKLPKENTYGAKCLFGEHLLLKYPAQTVALVESPKNAIVGELEQPQMLWLATGNKTMFKRKYLMVLRGRDVMVFPDCDAIDNWTHEASRMKDIANFTISDFCRRIAPKNQPKYDIADYFIDKRKREILDMRGEL